MKIDRIVLTHVRIPLEEPFRASNGEIMEKDGIVVRVFADGLVGVGEASPRGGTFASWDTPASVWGVLRERLVPAVLEAGIGSVEEINALFNRQGGSTFARAGLETAFWDLKAQMMGVPLHAALGGKTTAIASGLAIGIYPHIPALLGAIEKHMAEGYKRLKIKIRPGWDIGPLSEIRQRFGDIPLMVDADCAYTRKEIPHLRMLDAFNLTMIEQPLARKDLSGHGELQRSLKTPICLDEGADDIMAVRRAIALGACRIVNIKIQRVGGLSHALAMHDFCVKNHVPVWGGTMPELGIGGIQTLHLSSLGGFSYPTDVASSRRWYGEDIIDPPIVVSNGMIELPAAPGNGVALVERIMERHRVAEQVFTSATNSGST